MHVLGTLRQQEIVICPCVANLHGHKKMVMWHVQKTPSPKKEGIGVDITAKSSTMTIIDEEGQQPSLCRIESIPTSATVEKTSKKVE